MFYIYFILDINQRYSISNKLIFKKSSFWRYLIDDMAEALVVNLLEKSNIKIRDPKAVSEKLEALITAGFDKLIVSLFIFLIL